MTCNLNLATTVRPGPFAAASSIGRRLTRRVMMGLAPALLAGSLMASPAHAAPTLFYNSSNGVGAAVYINTAGTLASQQTINGFAPWTHVTSVDGGIDPVSLRSYRQTLFVNSYTGAGATARMYYGGEGYAMAQVINGFYPWTHVVGLRYSGGLVLFVNTYTGLGVTGRVNEDGSFTNLQVFNGFGPWTHITGLYGGLVLFYNANNGVGATGRVNADGSFVNLKTISGFAPWTHNTGCGTPSQDPGRVLFVNSTTGLGATGRINADGSLTNLKIYRGFGPWTHITGFAGGQVYFYNANSGVGEGAMVYADGTFENRTVTSGFAAWTHVNGDSSDGIAGH